MFVGHTALALAARPKAPAAPLGLLLGAAVGLDLLWPVFLLAALARFGIVPGTTAVTPLRFGSYPWSHSLLMALVWAALLAALAGRSVGWPAAGLVAALVVSHWVLDFVSHAPDMPLWPGRSPLLG